MFKVSYWQNHNRGSVARRGGAWVEFDTFATELAAEKAVKLLESRGLEVDLLELGFELDFGNEASIFAE